MKPDNLSEFSLVCGEFSIIVKASSELEAAMKMAFDVLEQIKQNLDAINGHKVCLQVLYTQECIRRDKELSHFRAFFDRKRSNTRGEAIFEEASEMSKHESLAVQIYHLQFLFELFTIVMSLCVTSR